jgi:predicted aspartyl protease
MIRKHLFRRGCLSATITLLAAAALTGSGAGDQGDAVLATLPIDLLGGYVRLELRVNGSELLNFIFDTGATRTGIDSGTADRLGLAATERSRSNGAGGVIVEHTIGGVEIELGGLVLADRELLSRAGQLVRRRLDPEIDGVIGADLLRDYVVEIDYDRKLLVVHDPQGYAYGGAGERLEIDANRYFSTIHATIDVGDGQTLAGRFLIDTGAGVSLALNTPFVNEHDLVARIGKTDVERTMNASGVEMSSYPGTVQRFALGGFGFDDMPVLLSQTAAGPLSPTAIAGIIGNPVWRRFNTVFDYRRDAIYLQPNSSFDEPFDDYSAEPPRLR